MGIFTATGPGDAYALTGSYLSGSAGAAGGLLVAGLAGLAALRRRRKS